MKELLTNVWFEIPLGNIIILIKTCRELGYETKAIESLNLSANFNFCSIQGKDRFIRCWFQNIFLNTSRFKKITFSEFANQLEHMSEGSIKFKHGDAVPDWVQKARKEKIQNRERVSRALGWEPPEKPLYYCPFCRKTSAVDEIGSVNDIIRHVNDEHDEHISKSGMELFQVPISTEE